MTDADSSGALLALLEKHGIHGASIERSPGGFSNVTYMVSAPTGDVVLRIPPPGASHIKSGHDVVREGRFLTLLHPVFPLAPKPIAVIEDPPTLIMEKKLGRILRKKRADFSPEAMRAISERLVDALVALHTVDVHETGLASLGRPDGYVQRQVDGWRERYEKSRTDEISDMERLSRWIAANVPPSRFVSVTHNDFKYDNVVINDAGELTGILDWELAAIGDPMTDLATMLAYWIEATDDPALHLMPLGPTSMPGNLTRNEIVARYEERSGRSVEHLLFHVALASFRIAVIAQQIYYRFAKGFLTDERFAPFGMAVAVVAARACRFLDAGRIDVP